MELDGRKKRTNYSRQYRGGTGSLPSPVSLLFVIFGGQMKITYQQLIDLGATCHQPELFKKTFASEATVTKANCIKAAQVGLDINWLARRVLKAPAWEEYEKVCAPAREEYEKVCDAAWEEFEKVCAPAWEEHEKVCAPAREEYEKVCAIAFWKAVMKMEAQ